MAESREALPGAPDPPARMLHSVAAAPTAVDDTPVTAPAPGTRDNRSAYAARDLTEGSIPRNLWFLAWPQVIESMLNVADQLADLIWAGRLGTRAIAGLGVAQTYVQLGNTGRMGFDMAMRAYIARAVGAGDIARANHVALQAFSLSGVFSVTMALVGVFFTEPLLQVLGVPDSVVAAGADYMRVQFIGSGTNAFRMMSGAALQASGDAMTPMRAATVGRVIHLILSPMLMFGWLFFPEMGLVGAAVGNIIAQGAGATINFSALFRGTSRLHLNLAGYRPDPVMIWQLVKTGAPASVTQGERAFAQLLLIGFVSPYGAATLAAFSLSKRLENLVMMGARGFGQASGVLVGQNLGAGKPERARKTVAWAVLFVFVANMATSVVLLAFPSIVVKIFNADPELVEVAAKWLQIAAIGFLFMGIGQVFQQSYNIAGDTLAPMIVTLLSIWVVQQPLAVILPDLGLDQFGIAWAVVAAVFARLLFYFPYYLTDRWLKVRL